MDHEPGRRQLVQVRRRLSNDCRRDRGYLARPAALAASKWTPASDHTIIECQRLEKWYSGVHALKNVSLSVARGEAVGLVGDNGAGKCTLIKILSGVPGPTQER